MSTKGSLVRIHAHLRMFKLMCKLMFEQVVGPIPVCTPEAGDR